MDTTERQPQGFQPTRWSIVLGARGESEEARKAIERLVGVYWGPVYWSLRRGWGRRREDAKDLTQEFFTRLLERGVGSYDPAKGKFRSFLCAAVKHFLLQERRDASREKRGGGQLPFSLDQIRDDGGEPAAESPESVFDQEWARSVIDEATARLRDEARLAGDEASFRLFESHLAGGVTYESLAREHSLTVNDVERRLKQMRARMRELIRASVRETLASDAELNEELRQLFG